MNSFDLFWNNKRMVQSTQSAIHAFLSSQSKAQIVAKTSVLNESEIPIEVKSLALLRLNGKKTSTAVVVGSSQNDFQKIFYEVIAPTDGTPSLDPKVAESNLMKAIFAALDVELKASQINLDPKSVIIIPNKVLGDWNTVSTNHSVQFPFTTPKGELVFEIPLLNEEAQQEKFFSFYGFPETSRILVVDDAPTTRKLVSHFLASVGYQNIEECVDGQAALTKLLGSRPPFDLVIADWHMPNLTGFELLKKVRGIAELKNLPVILVTGERNQEEVIAAVRERVSGYVVKPFDGETLYKAMKKAAQTAQSTAVKRAS